MSNQQNDIYEEQQRENSEELLSSCCGSQIFDDMDICKDCGEHCGAVDGNDKEYEFIINKWELKQ